MPRKIELYVITGINIHPFEDKNLVSSQSITLSIKKNINTLNNVCIWIQNSHNNEIAKNNFLCR